MAQQHLNSKKYCGLYKLAAMPTGYSSLNKLEVVLTIIVRLHRLLPAFTSHSRVTMTTKMKSAGDDKQPEKSPTSLLYQQKQCNHSNKMLFISISNDFYKIQSVISVLLYFLLQGNHSGFFFISLIYHWSVCLFSFIFC